MNLNTLSPAIGSRQPKKRLGRGIGSGLGKTSGKGHKGQKARAGGYHKINFEGGEMPIQRRLPKMGFRSSKNIWHAEVLLSHLQGADAAIIDLALLKEKKLVHSNTESVKVILSGSIDKPITLKGLKVTKGARE